MKVSFALLSDRGPRQINEDTIACWSTRLNETVACVADGLGGMGAGDVASQLVVNAFREGIDDKVFSLETAKNAALYAHQLVRRKQLASQTQSRMASTLTAICLMPGRILGVHCGDSRAVLARGNGIKRLTKDHSEGQRLFDAGKLTKAEFLHYERKHILESAIGDETDPRIDFIDFELVAGDRIFLSTDGFHNVVLLSELQRASTQSRTPDELIQRVHTLIASRQVSDNFSLAALFA